MNERDRYRGSDAERFSNQERGDGWRRDDDGSLLDRGDHPREAWSRERSGENEWQRDYGSRAQGHGPSRAYQPDSSRYGEAHLARRARGELNYASMRLGGFSGRGPKGYTRSDERIREDVCEHLSENDEVDASDIEVMVKDRKVTLTGTVENRRMKHLAEDITEMVSGVQDVDNRVTVRKPLLKDMADRIMGREPEGHFANTGTKDSSASNTMQTANGRP